MITVGKVSTKIDFQENEVMPLLHGTRQFISPKQAKIFHQLIGLIDQQFTLKLRR